jgi:hypothetical protein
VKLQRQKSPHINAGSKSRLNIAYAALNSSSVAKTTDATIGIPKIIGIIMIQNVVVLLEKKKWIPIAVSAITANRITANRVTNFRSIFLPHIMIVHLFYALNLIVVRLQLSKLQFLKLKKLTFSCELSNLSGHLFTTTTNLP